MSGRTTSHQIASIKLAHSPELFIDLLTDFMIDWLMLCLFFSSVFILFALCSLFITSVN